MFITGKQTYVWKKTPFTADFAISCHHFKDSDDFNNTRIAFKLTFKDFLKASGLNYTSKEFVIDLKSIMEILSVVFIRE